MGVGVRHRSDIVKTIKRMDFNSVRFPYSDQMVLENPIVDPKHARANLDLLEPCHETSEPVDQHQVNGNVQGPRALDAFKASVTAMTNEGLAVVPNNRVALCVGQHQRPNDCR
jgi:endoglucanase